MALHIFPSSPPSFLLDSRPSFLLQQRSHSLSTFLSEPPKPIEEAVSEGHLPRSRLPEREGVSDGIQQPKNPTQPSGVPRSAVCNITSSKLDDLPIFIEGQTENLGRRLNFRPRGLKPETSLSLVSGHSPAEIPHSGGFQGVHSEVEVLGVQVRERPVEVERLYGLQVLILRQRPHHREHKSEVLSKQVGILESHSSLRCVLRECNQPCRRDREWFGTGRYGLLFVHQLVPVDLRYPTRKGKRRGRPACVHLVVASQQEREGRTRIDKGTANNQQNSPQTLRTEAHGVAQKRTATRGETLGRHVTEEDGGLGWRPVRISSE
mmetsp:Transcript_33841/g.67044  ORF Transcript_33841/g.67044 Transcript_33841/m.67044 type:complete len:321 (-) Transcript_33841:21-983(-)